MPDSVLILRQIYSACFQQGKRCGTLGSCPAGRRRSRTAPIALGDRPLRVAGLTNYTGRILRVWLRQLEPAAGAVLAVAVLLDMRTGDGGEEDLDRGAQLGASGDGIGEGAATALDHDG